MQYTKIDTKMATFTKISLYVIFALVTIHEGKAGLLQACTNNAECQVNMTGDPNAVCANATVVGGDDDGNCICTGAYRNNTNNTGCMGKGNGDSCSADSDCAAVNNSACESDNTCGCADGYTVTGTTCSADSSADSVRLPGRMITFSVVTVIIAYLL